MAFEWTGASGLWLRYHLECDLETLVLPLEQSPLRADNLWKTTCFELFLAFGSGAEYAEFNFSPSSQWAAYRFEGYREGVSALDLDRAPVIALDASAGHFAVEIELSLPQNLTSGGPMALSAVIEEKSHVFSYWALHHPADRPDFHHRDCFAAHLPPPPYS